jgi:hypothetical protein
LPTGPYLAGQPGLDVVEPSSLPAPARGHDGLPRDRVEAKNLDDGLAVQPRLPTGVDEEQEPVAEKETEARVIEVDG